MKKNDSILLPDDSFFEELSKKLEAFVFICVYAKMHNISFSDSIDVLEKNGVIGRSDLNEQKR